MADASVERWVAKKDSLSAGSMAATKAAQTVKRKAENLAAMRVFGWVAWLVARLAKTMAAQLA